mmetsp:Transcript_7499/g.30382  ORF Transcript_7499/g.30382 Transcript_7499/m.30382 type:complete len:214 (-) Transcript_7499:401-1042(-)
MNELHNRRARPSRVDERHPVPNDRQPVLGDDALRVKLHALDLRVPPVPHRHDRLVLRPRGDLQLVIREPVSRDDERVIPRRLEGRREPGEHRGGVLGVPHRGRFAVHQTARRPDDGTAENLPDALVTHAHAEDSKLGPELLARLERDAAVLRPPRSGGDHDALGVHRANLLHGLLVVLEHDVVLPEVAEVLSNGGAGGYAGSASIESGEVGSG